MLKMVVSLGAMLLVVGLYVTSLPAARFVVKIN